MTPNASERNTEFPRGTYARIARRLRPKVTMQFVGLVDRGVKRSARVEAALRRERERLLMAQGFDGRGD